MAQLIFISTEQIDRELFKDSHGGSVLIWSICEIDDYVSNTMQYQVLKGFHRT